MCLLYDYGTAITVDLHLLVARASGSMCLRRLLSCSLRALGRVMRTRLNIWRHIKGVRALRADPHTLLKSCQVQGSCKLCTARIRCNNVCPPAEVVLGQLLMFRLGQKGNLLLPKVSSVTLGWDRTYNDSRGIDLTPVSRVLHI